MRYIPWLHPPNTRPPETWWQKGVWCEKNVQKQKAELYAVQAT